jgi:bcr-type benzoyl-CoA reductase subunit C
MADFPSDHAAHSPIVPLESLKGVSHAPLRDWPGRYQGHTAMGYLCSYVPLEIIHAGGFVPVRVRGNSKALRHVDAHLQSFTCALCRSSLDQVLGGELSFLAGAVFAHTCDTMQALADLWRMNTTASHFVDVVMQPANLGSPAARPYLVAELGRFRSRLADFAGRPIRDTDLLASIAIYNRSRQLVQALNRQRGRLSTPDFYAILDAGQSMPPQEYNLLLAQLLEGLDAPTEPDGPRLFLVGAVLDEPRLLDLIQDLGGQVVGDDLCSGMRPFCDQVGDGDPLVALAEYYLRRSPCPTKFQPLHDVGRELLAQVREVRAQGIVYVLEKFCEPHAFDYAMAIPALDRAGVPHLLLEMEQTPSLEALRTRLQAFVEILQ